MLNSVVTPNRGHPVVYYFASGAAVWGQAITPSIAHLVQTQRWIAIDYARIAPGIVFQIVSGQVMTPHVIDQSTFRLHADAATLRQAMSSPEATPDAVLRCEVGDACALKLWGRVSKDEQAPPWDPQSHDGAAMTVPIIFTVTFWEIAPSSEAQIRNLTREVAEKDRLIRELTGKVALAMCSQ
jgi:hypothetical protein